MVTREEQMEIIDDMAATIYDMCGKIMDSLEAELNEAELLHSEMYMKYVMLRDSISKSLNQASEE